MDSRIILFIVLMANDVLGVESEPETTPTVELVRQLADKLIHGNGGLLQHQYENYKKGWVWRVGEAPHSMSYFQWLEQMAVSSEEMNQWRG